MCGISGCLDNGNNAMISVIHALRRLENRGYDSVGICSIKNGKIDIKKAVKISNDDNTLESIELSKLGQSNCNIAIGHTRWATHGGKTIQNAHPHTDITQRFAMVHNGIIENYADLKAELFDAGIKDFYGQTDTEIAVNYLNLLFKRSQTYSDLHKVMKGSWAMLITDINDPRKIHFLKNGSPLILGFNETKTKIMFVSELIGFDKDIVSYAIIPDDDYGYVSLENGKCRLENTCPLNFINLKVTEAETSPHPYQHWTLKEINDQPDAIKRLLKERIGEEQPYHLNFPEFEKFKTELEETEHLIFLACGTSYHAAQLGVKYFKEFRSKMTTEVIDGADFEEYDIPTNRKTVIVLLSQSGETKELHMALKLGKEHGIRSIGLINVENSLIAREVDICLYLRAGREHAVASTKSFTNQVIMLLLMALKMNKVDPVLYEKYITDLSKLSLDYVTMIKQSKEEVPQIVKLFEKQTDCFILGKHSCQWIANEGSLKIKEISYLHSEGFSAAALKHGPFALLTHNIPVILIANNDRFYSKLENTAAEVSSRYANVIFITNKKPNIIHGEKSKNDHIKKLFYFESDSRLFPLLAIVPLQYLAYLLALDRKNNPDKPRNLAKVVTVE
jgi:glucosamine--fructose-6-phosphate aminotransferase (isomerizing)